MKVVLTFLNNNFGFGSKAMKFLQADHILGKILRLPKNLMPREKQVRILRGPLKGSRWLTGVGPEGWWLGLSEQEKLGFVASKVRKGGVFYDVGANVGLYSLLAANSVGPAGRVIAFEPSTRNCGFFKRHMEMNKIENFSLHQIAIAESDGVAKFDDDGDPVGFRVASHGKTTVQQRKLDSLVESKELPPPTYLKIDVEGAELEVLEGAKNIIKNHQPEVFIETHERFVPGVHQACIRWLEQNGYKVLEFCSEVPKIEIYGCPKGRL